MGKSTEEKYNKCHSHIRKEFTQEVSHVEMIASQSAKFHVKEKEGFEENIGHGNRTSDDEREAFVEIENEEPDAVPLPVWLQLLDVEAAALLDESESIRGHIRLPQ
jgi:hypothetical protein